MRKLTRREAIGLAARTTGALLVPGWMLGACDAGSRAGGPEVLNEGLDAGSADFLGEADAATPGHRVNATVSPDLSGLRRMAEGATDGLGITSGSMTGSTVFIKPNVVSMGLGILGIVFDPTNGVCTNPELVATVAERCLEAGAARVVIGDGAQGRSWDWSTLHFLDGHDIGGATNLQSAVDRLATRFGGGCIELQCLDLVGEWVPIPSSSTHDSMSEGLFVAKAFAEADHVISMPVVKTHQWSVITAALKNYVGVVSNSHHGNGMARCKLHLAYADASCHGEDNAAIHGAYADVHKWRMDEGRQDFAIVDATICLEGDGPQKSPPGMEGGEAGNPMTSGGDTLVLAERNAAGVAAVLAADNLVAADIAVSRVMGVEPTSVKGLRMMANVGFAPEAGVRLEGASFDEIAVADWKPATVQEESFFSTFCPA